MRLRLPRTTSYDLVLLLVVVALTLLGIAMVFSASGIRALDTVDDPRYYLGWQALWASLGLVGMVAAMRLDYHRYRALAVPLVVIVVALLVAVLVPGVGVRAGGAARWLRAGAVGLQPAELAKLALIVYLAAWFGPRRERLAIVLVAIAMTMYFIAGARLRIFGALAGLALVSVLAVAVAQPYRLARLVTFLDPWSDPKGAGFQAIQSLYGLALGGVFGEGLGAGREKFGFLPAPYTDSIFAVLGDEIGLAGTLVVIVLFFAIAYRGIAIALRAKDSTGALFAAGITTWLVFQAWVNMAVVASLVPMTGITLPFISYGGSSLCVGLIAVGILLNVGREAGPTVSRAPGRRRNGRSYQPAARDRRGAARPGPRGAAPVHRWSSRARG
ncbi:MAG: cell division protein FtsW [Chloroflexi bacterium]|nr:MAG: cell division protein FtsW [Chloroflexota bacterium]